ncbi:hypothetical protein N7495_006948 [Penicillium taxi]|uniref:uncharacterized protein n=1 Tax=Penicillium taxi TaxID=168475 RepID=UPI0025452A0E|nr:uncharacterized protein N7495_006948 [Penicillium taxi]KAJ5895257.1 hypothetical protein N7495_006948 [Penicillium taxi]
MAFLDYLLQIAAVLVRNYVYIVLGLPAAYLILNRYFHPLKRVPGPFLASFSKIWLLYHALSGSQHVTEMEAHKKYG